MHLPRVLAASVALAILAGAALADGSRILVQSTTSTQNSGLYDHILPLFEDATGIRVDVVAVGTGQAIRNASRGDADVLLVHSEADELAFVAEGHGLERHPFMYNDFVIVGPQDDPAGVAEAGTLVEALERLQAGAAPFLSRGDDSGTHKKELALWETVGGPPEAGGWYRETGSGMGATLRVTTEMQGYTLTDRATWLSFGARGDYRIVHEGAAELFNQYGVIQLDPARHEHVNADGAGQFVDWLVGAEGQAAIAAFEVDGQQLFFPNAGKG